MNDAIFKMYSDTKSLIKRAMTTEIGGVAERELIKEWNQATEILESSSPDYKNRYEQLVKNQESFTQEQINFICYQIGDWYIEWKDRLVIDLKEGTHRLGYAKEALKTMICGD
jgi:hypothetical protein